MAYQSSDNESVSSIESLQLPPKFQFKRHVVVSCSWCHQQVLPLKLKQAKDIGVRMQVCYFKRDASDNTVYFMCIKKKFEYRDCDIGIWGDVSCGQCHTKIGEIQEGKSRFMFKFPSRNILCEPSNKHQLPSNA